LVPVLSQTKPVHTIFSYFLNIHFNITLKSILPSSKQPLLFRFYHQTPCWIVVPICTALLFYCNPIMICIATCFFLLVYFWVYDIQPKGIVLKFYTHLPAVTTERSGVWMLRFKHLGQPATAEPASWWWIICTFP
jgi:hypothetical protein